MESYFLSWDGKRNAKSEVVPVRAVSREAELEVQRHSFLTLALNRRER